MYNELGCTKKRMLLLGDLIPYVHAKLHITVEITINNKYSCFKKIAEIPSMDSQETRNIRSFGKFSDHQLLIIHLKYHKQLLLC